jgi:glycerophosphoryl diester phosphodiesterase
MGRYPYLDAPDGRGPIAFAHRGGAKLFPENTRVAIEGALALGYTHVETDVQLTKDGVIVLFHDLTVDRTSNGTGRVSDLTLEELRALDLGYRFVALDGTHAYRGHDGARVVTLEEALAIDPALRLNLEMKVPMARELWELIERRRVHDRVLGASGKQRWGDELRALSRGRIATSPGVAGVLRFWLGVRSGLHRALELDWEALQVPWRKGPLTVVDRRFVEAAHAHGVQVHVWTIDAPSDMNALLDLGVDAIMTDRPDVLREVLAGRLGPAP